MGSRWRVRAAGKTQIWLSGLLPMNVGIRRVRAVLRDAQSWVLDRWGVDADEETGPSLSHDEIAEVLAVVNSLVDQRWLGGLSVPSQAGRLETCRSYAQHRR